jgi:hypothetical protein
MIRALLARFRRRRVDPPAPRSPWTIVVDAHTGRERYRVRDLTPDDVRDDHRPPARRPRWTDRRPHARRFL